MPSLSQIQNFFKGLRRKFRESYNIDDIKEFLLALSWDNDLSGDDFLVLVKSWVMALMKTTFKLVSQAKIFLLDFINNLIVIKIFQFIEH